MTNPNEIKTPELEKLKAVREQSQIIGEFLDYMGDRGYTMCEDVNDDGRYSPTRMNIERMLAFFFEIDLDKCEEERVALLDSIRNKDN